MWHLHCVIYRNILQKTIKWRLGIEAKHKRFPFFRTRQNTLCYELILSFHFLYTSFLSACWNVGMYFRCWVVYSIGIKLVSVPQQSSHETILTCSRGKNIAVIRNKIHRLYLLSMVLGKRMHRCDLVLPLLALVECYII